MFKTENSINISTTQISIPSANEEKAVFSIL